MDKTTQIENQYKNLWDNMQQTNSQNFVLIVGIIAASAGIITAGFDTIKEIDVIKEGAALDAAIVGCIFMCVYMITIPGQFLLNGNRRHIWRQSTYIRVFLEPYLESSKYETNVAKRNTQEKAKKLLSSGIIENEWLIIFIINSIVTIASSFCFRYSHYFSKKFNVTWIIIMVVMFWISISLFFWMRLKKLKRGKKVENSHFETWMKIRLQPNVEIFQITNLIEKKYFISRSTNLALEWHSQKWQLDNGEHINSDLQRDWKKYGGVNNFNYEILEEIPNGQENKFVGHSENLNTRVQFFESLQLSLSNKLYNMKIEE